MTSRYQDDNRKYNKRSREVDRFGKLQGLSEHTAPFDALVYNFDGKAEVIIEGKPHLLGAGDIIIMPANKPHVLKAIERFKMLLVMVKA